MATLPPSTDFTGSSVTQGGAKTFVSTLRTFLSDLLGTDSSNKSAARAALGLPTSSLGYRNKVINGRFAVDSRAVASSGTLSAGQYLFDGWKAGASGCTYSFATSNNLTTLTISAGSMQQVVEGINLMSATYSLTWTGTAQGKIAAGSYGASGVTGSVTGGTNTTIEFNTGTLTLVQFEEGTNATSFEHRSLTLAVDLRSLSTCVLLRCQRGGWRGVDVLIDNRAAAGQFPCPDPCSGNCRDSEFDRLLDFPRRRLHFGNVRYHDQRRWKEPSVS